VSTSGNDSNSGNISHPWRTLQYTADTASAGSIIYIRGGTYLGFTLERPKLTFCEYPGEEVIIVGHGISINTIKVRNILGGAIQNIVQLIRAVQLLALPLPDQRPRPCRQQSPLG
jgi:hypothetical protein